MINRERLSPDAAGILVRHVAVATARSVPLSNVLEALGDDSGDRRLTSAAFRLAERLRAGEALDDALAQEGAAFPAQIRGILMAGVRSNNLPLVLEGYAGLDLSRRHLSAIARSTMAYPLLIAALLIPVLLLISLYVAPMFENLFQEFGMVLPASTRVAFRTAQAAPFALGALLVVPAGGTILLSVCGGHWLLHRLRGAMPVFGPLWTWAGQNELASLLKILVSARLPLDEAVMTASHALVDRNIARACPHLSRAVAQGVPLGEALDRSMHFDRALAPLVSWGEEHDLLEEALDIFAHIMRTRLENYAALLQRVVPVAALAFIATLIAGIAVAGFLSPLLTLISGLSGGAPAATPPIFGFF